MMKELNKPIKKVNIGNKLFTKQSCMIEDNKFFCKNYKLHNTKSSYKWLKIHINVHAKNILGKNIV